MDHVNVRTEADRSFSCRLSCSNEISSTCRLSKTGGSIGGCKNLVIAHHRSLMSVKSADALRAAPVK